MNEYKIFIETKDVSDKEKAEKIRQSLQNPISAVKDQDIIRETIAEIVAKLGSNLTEKDLKFMNQVLEQLSSITKNAIRDIKVKSKSGNLLNEGLVGSFKNTQDIQAKSVKEVNNNLKDAANDIKTAAKELQKAAKEVKTKETEQPSIVRKKKKIKTSIPWVDEEPPIFSEESKPVGKKTLKKKQNLVQPVSVTEVSKAEVTKIPRTISRRLTGKEMSLIESSDALMTQIRSDFIRFKNSFADIIKTRLEAEHAGSFQLVEGKNGIYTRRGGTEVLKIANMKLLTDALSKLTNSVEKTAALEKEGPAAMIKEASSYVATNMLASMGKTSTTQQEEALKRIAAYINKYGYVGENKAVQKLVDEQIKKERKVPLAERKGININQLREAVGEDISTIIAETIGRKNINNVIGKAIQEIVIPRPVAGPQGLPAIKLQSGRYRALTPEYEFTPGILAASEFAGKLIKTGSKNLPYEAIVRRVQKAISTVEINEKTGKRTVKVPDVKQMLVKNDIAGIASLSSDIIEIMKTDKKGRLELINAYEKVLSSKGKGISKEHPTDKREQLAYLDKLAVEAKKLALGFDDVVVAMGKLSKSNIYNRLLGSLTAENVGGKTSPIRTTIKNIGIDEEAINQFNKRIREPFTQQELVDEYKPRLSYYQSKVSKLISPRLTSGREGVFVNSVETKAALKALNRETEKYLALRKNEAGIPKKLTSQGIAEGRAVSIHEDPRNVSRIITNAFTEDIRQLMPLGEWSNFGRNIASTYQGIGGGRTKGGVIIGSLEEPLLKSKRSAEIEKSGAWGNRGYGLNLQTVLADSAHTFEDQIEIAGKAVNRFSEYIRPKIENVKDIESAKLVAEDIVGRVAPEIGKQLSMKGFAKFGEDKKLISEVSEILTSKTGASLEQRAVSVVERIFTSLGTKITTHAMSKGIVTFKSGKEGELGYTIRPTFTHELMADLLRKKKGINEEKDKEIDKILKDLSEVGNAPFVDFMHRDLSKQVQERFKKIKNAVLKMLEINPSLSNEDLINEVNSMARKVLGEEAMTKKVPNEVRMTLSGAVRRLNLNEPLEAVFNNIAGNVKAIAPTNVDLSPNGEVSRVLQAMGYTFGPEQGKSKQSLPMYSQVVGMGNLTQAISGQKFWQYTRNPNQEEEWKKEDILYGHKGQKMNIAAMGAITSIFGEKSPVTKEAMSAYMPNTEKAIEALMALKSLSNDLQSIPKEAYIATRGLKELPGVIEKYEDLRNTILDLRFSAGGYVKIPKFNKEKKEIGTTSLYVPSRATLGTFEQKGQALGANTLATRFSSLLANIEQYERIKKQVFLKTDKPDIDVLRRNVATEIGAAVRNFRKVLDSVIFDKKKGALGKNETKSLFEFLNKLYSVLSKMTEAERVSKVPGLNKEVVFNNIKNLEEGLVGGVLAKKGGGIYKAKNLLMQLKDIIIEPKVDTKNIERALKDVELLKRGGSFANLSEQSYFYYKSMSRKKPNIGEEGFEKETAEARRYIINGLNKYVKTLKYGNKNIGVLSASTGAVMEGAKQFGVTTNPKQQGIEESIKNIERDKRRLEEELLNISIGKGKGIDILQTRRIPAIRGEIQAALVNKIDDFEKALNMLNNLLGKGVLKDTDILQRITAQATEHKKALEKEVAEGAISLKENEVGLPAGKIEKLTGEYGKGKTALDAIREGQKITVMTTRFPYTGLSSSQFAKVKELTHPSSRNIISLPGGTPIGVDMIALDADIKKLIATKEELQVRRRELPEAAPGTVKEKELNAKREELTTTINELIKVIDLLETKFHGYAQAADFDGDNINVHAARTKEAAEEMERVAKSYHEGKYGLTQDPRAFINKMMSYKAVGLKSSMVELAEAYSKKSGIPGAKLFQTPDITKELKGMTMSEVMAALAKEGITQKYIDAAVRKKGLEGRVATEKVARSLLYDKLRSKQYEKIYVKSGLGESTESINRIARFLEASIGFGNRPLNKKEYSNWKKESVALGAVYNKKGILEQAANPAREMQTMMNHLLNVVINSGMSAKHGGKPLFEEISHGIASGKLSKMLEEDAKLPEKDRRFNGILKANEVIKDTIRNRLDALNSVDFAVEAKRFNLSGKGRKAITDELVKMFSFEGFINDLSRDIKNQIYNTIVKQRVESGISKERAAKLAEREINRGISTGTLNVGSYFGNIQPIYSLRSSSVSINSLAKQATAGKTELDKAMSHVLNIIKSSGEGVTFSDILVNDAFKKLFDMFRVAENFGNKLDRAFVKGKTLKQKENIIRGIEKKTGTAPLSMKEKEMIMAEGAEKFKAEYPNASEEDILKFKRQYLVTYRQQAVRRQVEIAKYKRDLISRTIPEIGEAYQGYRAVKQIIRPPSKTEKEINKTVVKIPKSKTASIDYSMFGKGSAKNFVNVLTKYRKVLRLLSENARSLTDKEVKKAKEALQFIEAHRTDLESIPIRKMGHKVSYDILALYDKIKKTKQETSTTQSQVKTASIDYSMFGKGNAKNFVNVLTEYKEALEVLTKDFGNLTNKKLKKIKEALKFIKTHKADLENIPVGGIGYKVSRDVLGLYNKIKKMKEKASTTASSAPPLVPPITPPVPPIPFEPPGPSGSPKQPPIEATGMYKSSLEALIAMTTKAEATTGYSSEGVPRTVVDALEGLRSRRLTPFSAAGEIKKAISEGIVPKEKIKSIWKQYHIEKVKSQILRAQEAQREGDYEEREKAILLAKERIVGTYGSSITPFLVRAKGGTGRVIGHIDEAAAAKLGVQRVPVQKKDLFDSIARESKTAAEAIKPLLFGSDRMEERLKATWKILRGFSPELVKAGKYAKAFDFGNAKADIAIIREALSKLKLSGNQMSADEFADIEHALKQTKKMQTVLQETPFEALPTVAIPGLESKETAEAAWKNLLAKTAADMEKEYGISVGPGTKRKVSMRVPTSEGLVERRTAVLVAKGSEAGGVAGKFAGVSKVDEKSIIEQAYEPSRRAIRLFEQFLTSTDKMKSRIQELYLGVKRFKKETGEVNFDSALEDLRDLQILIQNTLQQPELTEEKKIDLRHLRRKVISAYKTIAETTPEAMPGIIMKGMETPESAEAAFNKQIELKKKQMLEMENLEPGMFSTVAATIPTATGLKKRKVRLVAKGNEEGVITGIKEEEYKSKNAFIEELLSDKSKRIVSLFKTISEGTGDVYTRIQNMILAVKKFDLSMAKAGKYAKAINFDTAESDLTEMISLFNRLLDGATTLTDKEREMYIAARAAAKEMQRQVVRTPITARAGITVRDYETPMSSLAAYEAKIKAAEEELKKLNELGKRVIITGKVLDESGQEVTRRTRLTARGNKWFGFGGNVSKVVRKDELPGTEGRVESVIRRVAMWGAASGAVYGTINVVRQMVNTMKEAEVGMTNLKKVMPSVGTDFNKMRKSAMGFAKRYGVELKGVLETMRIFAQQGLSQSKVLEMTRVSTLASNVTTMTPTESAEALTSATRQFNVEGENSIRILDSWNAVENKFAITAADLAEGFKKAGTAARIAGFNMHELNGMITAIGETTRQNGKAIGTSLKFIFSRLGEKKAPKVLADIGIQTTVGGERRKGSDILRDLAEKWVTLTRAQKLSIAQAIGGIRHYTALMVLMENYDRALAATATSMNSLGSADRENAMVMKTYEKQLAQTKASFDALAVSASGPVLSALKLFTGSLRSIIDLLNKIPSGGLAPLLMGSYGAAVGLGKYFDLSMFGLLGERQDNGERRKRRRFIDMPKIFYEKYAPIGEDVLKNIGRSEEIAASGAFFSKISIRPLTKIKNVFAGIKYVAEGAAISILGFIKSLGPLVWISLGITAITAAFWKMDKVINNTFSNADARTKNYAKSLAIVKTTLKTLDETKIPYEQLRISKETVGALSGQPIRRKGETEEEFNKRRAFERKQANDIKQITARVMEGSYKSPILLQKKEAEQIKRYVNAVAMFTTAGTFGFDKFGNAIVNTTDKLNNVVKVLEKIAAKSKINIKLHIIKEGLKDLTGPPEVNSFWKKMLLKFRNVVRGTGKLFGANLEENNLNIYEKISETTAALRKMRIEAHKTGREIVPPSVELKETNQSLYSKRKEEFEKYMKLTTALATFRREYDAKFAKLKQSFQSIGYEMSPELAKKVAYSQTGRMLANIEAKQSLFYKLKGITPEEIQASYYHKHIGAEAIGPTAEITRARAMEQGIMPRFFGTGQQRQALLKGLREGDIILTRSGAKFKDVAGKFSIVGNQIQVYREGVEKGGRLMVTYVKKAADSVKPFTQTAEDFKKLYGTSKALTDVISSVGMLTEDAKKLRAISVIPTGAGAGMFKFTPETRLDLGKQYKFEMSTGLLMQNNAFGNFSKRAVSFINEYAKQQARLRKEQKQILSLHKNKGAAISAAEVDDIEKMAKSLSGVANTAVRVSEAITDMNKSLESATLKFREQEAVQKARRETEVITSGVLTGMPVLRTPQIDIRRFSELSLHEQLRKVSPRYEKLAVAADKQLGVYNEAIRKTEIIAKTIADIKFIEKETKNLTPKQQEKVMENTFLTGNKTGGLTLTELSNQTSLLRENVRHLESIDSVLTDNHTKGLELAKKKVTEDNERAEKAINSHSVIKAFEALNAKRIPMAEVTKQVTSDIKYWVAKASTSGDYSNLVEYSNTLKKTFEKEAKNYYKKMGTDVFMESASPRMIKTILTTKGVGTEKEYNKAKSEGALDKLFYEKYDLIMAKFAGTAKSQAKSQVGTNKVVRSNLVNQENLLTKLAKDTIKDDMAYIRKKNKKYKEEAKEAGKVLSNFYNKMGEAQIALKTFNAVAGNLRKEIENLSVSFKKLGEQTAVSKALIDTRSQYMNIRGGPIKRQVPAINIDTATTANQYQPHQILYDKSSEYRTVTNRYLKEVEDVKVARAKLEQLSKIQAQKKFLEQQPGVTSEQVDRFLTSAMRTGDVKLAPVVSELSQIRENTAKIAINTLPTKFKNGAKKSINVESPKDVSAFITKMRSQAQLENKVAENKARLDADYLRRQQIELQTNRDIAAGRGKSQDQVNRETNEWMAAKGYVPAEIWRRNELLREVYEREKKARADFELAKQKELKPLQQSSGGMASLISAIQTGVANIKGERNIRPLERDLKNWAKSEEGNPEKVADIEAQFDLAKSLYIQNLDLRAQQIDTGIKPRTLYDIMKKASEGKDVTKDLDAIKEKLLVMKKKEDKQIRKVQAKEYAMALSSSPVIKEANTSLSDINENTRGIIDAVNANTKAKSIVKSVIVKKVVGTNVGNNGVIPIKETTKGKNTQIPKSGTISSYINANISKNASTCPTYTGAFTGPIREVVAPATNKVGSVVKNAQPVVNKEKVADLSKNMYATYTTDLKKEDKKIGKLKDEVVKNEQQSNKQNKKYANETKNLTNNISNLKNEVKDLENVISNVKNVFKYLSDSAKDISELGDASKGSTLSIEALGNAASKASISLSNISSKTSNESSKSAGTGPTMKADSKKGISFISKKEAEDLINLTKHEMLKKITKVKVDDTVEIGLVSKKTDFLADDVKSVKINIADNTAKIGLVSKKTDSLANDVKSIRKNNINISNYVNKKDFNEFKKEASQYFAKINKIETIESDISTLKTDINNLNNKVKTLSNASENISKDFVNSEEFNVFKAEVSGYIGTIKELKVLVDKLTNISSINKASISQLRTGFELIENKLSNYELKFTEIEEQIGAIDSKFTSWIKDLEEDVSTAIDLARSAYSMATSRI